MIFILRVDDFLKKFWSSNDDRQELDNFHFLQKIIENQHDSLSFDGRQFGPRWFMKLKWIKFKSNRFRFRSWIFVRRWKNASWRHFLSFRRAKLLVFLLVEILFYLKQRKIIQNSWCRSFRLVVFLVKVFSFCTTAQTGNQRWSKKTFFLGGKIFLSIEKIPFRLEFSRFFSFSSQFRFLSDKTLNVPKTRSIRSI